MVHYRPGSNKLTNEKSYARLTDREKSVWDGNRAMFPPVLATESREVGYMRDRGKRRRSVVDVRIWRRAVGEIVVVSWVKRRIIKRGLIRVVRELLEVGNT